MKNKILVLIVVLIIGGLICGCSQMGFAKNSSEKTSSIVEKIDSRDVAYASGVITETVDTEDAESKREEAKNIMLNSELFDGTEMDLWSGNGNTLIALKGTELMVYDVLSGNILANRETEKWSMVEAYPYNGGFCLIGEIGNIQNSDSSNDSESVGLMVSTSDETRECLGIIYNSELEEVSRIKLSDLVEDTFSCSWAISNDGKQLVYCDFRTGLNVYDCETGKNRQVLNISSEEMDKVKNIMGMDALFFEDGTDNLIFSAQTDNNQATYESWGRVKLDGTELENTILDKNSANACAYKNGLLVFGEESLFYPGTMGYVNTKTGEQVYFSDIKKGTNVGGPIVSDLGKVFAVSRVNELNDDIEIYSLSDFSKVSEQKLEESSKEFFYRAPNVYLFDEISTGIVTYGGHDGIPLKGRIIHY